MPELIDFASLPSYSYPAKSPAHPTTQDGHPYLYGQDFYQLDNSLVSRALPLDALSHFIFTATVYLL